MPGHPINGDCATMLGYWDDRGLTHADSVEGASMAEVSFETRLRTNDAILHSSVRGPFA
jgi:hypothetical protein